MAHNPKNPLMINSEIPGELHAKAPDAFVIPTPDGEIRADFRPDSKVLNLTLTGDIAPRQLAYIIKVFSNTRAADTPMSWTLLEERLRFGAALNHYDETAWNEFCQEQKAKAAEGNAA